MNAVINSVEQGLQWAVFEANSPILWKTLARRGLWIPPDLWTKGFFRGQTPEEAFYAKCDDETNPKETRDAGMVIECGILPVRPAEYRVQGPADVPQTAQAGE